MCKKVRLWVYEELCAGAGLNEATREIALATPCETTFSDYRQYPKYH